MLKRTQMKIISTHVHMTCQAFLLWLSLLPFVRFSYQFGSVICLFVQCIKFKQINFILFLHYIFDFDSTPNSLVRFGRAGFSFCFKVVVFRYCYTGFDVCDFGYASLVFVNCVCCSTLCLFVAEFNEVPSGWKFRQEKEVVWYVWLADRECTGLSCWNIHLLSYAMFCFISHLKERKDKVEVELCSNDLASW
jgi:hypothetical protein